MVLGVVLGVGTIAMAAAALRAQAPAAGAQPPAAQGPPVAAIEKVKDNLFVITGGGGNTAALVTANGVVVVDTKLAGWGQAILDKIKTVTDKPVTHIINTHTHGDHVGSNEFFPASVEIVAHENTAANMAKMPALQGPDKKHAMPDRTYKERMSLLDGRDRIDLYYFGAGHTNGDTIIVFPSLQTMHTGDLFAQRGAPLIDVNNGGSGMTYPDTLDRAVKGIRDVATVIPGHSAVTDWKAFAEFAEFNRAFLEAVRTAKAAGKTAEQAAAELTLPDRFKDFAMNRAKDNVAKIYAELDR
jgi:glyoxylase-like metal-dependent hydrolase (beta-lactamase superfamily II)